jgi:ADP-ribose pyrophosphatase YjhB (NUDIX family)
VALGLLSFSIVIILALSGISLWSWYRTTGPLAVEVFLFDDQDRLLLYRHPYHRVLIPPGGKVGAFESVHEAIKRTLRERVGLGSDAYDLQSLHPCAVTEQQFTKVSLLVCPFRIQIENHAQRRLKARHIDLFFFGIIRKEAKIQADPEYGPAHFWPRDQLARLVVANEIFPDVIDAYDALLKARKGETS